MQNCLFIRLVETILFFVFISISHPVYSQTDIEKATRETDRLGKERIIEEQLRRIPQEPTKIKPQEPPIIKEEEKFFIEKIELVGCNTFPAEEFASIIKKYKEREVTLSELETLAKEIEREYLNRGVIAAVFLPPQEIKEQTVILQVVEARMGELEIQEHKYFKKDRLNYYWKIPEGEILHYDKISKSIQMMNKNPDREVKAALHAGKKIGTTDILLTPKTRFPIHFISSFDNEGTLSTGKSRIGLGARHNNFLGLDDTLITGYTFGKDFSGIYTYHNLPLNSEGASLVYGYSRSESIPKKEYTSYEIKSEAKNTSVSIHQDLYKKDAYQGEVSLGFEAKDKTVKMNTGTYNRDRLRIISLGGNFIQRGFGSTTSLSPEFSQGIAAFGASSNSNPLASRGAKSTFSKFNLGVQHRKILPLNLQANLKFKSQVSSTKLTPQEEFSLGGIDSVRGYPSGDYLADNAILTNAELIIPSFFIPSSWRLPYAKESLKEQTTAVAFLDYGWGSRRGALPTEKKSVDFLGVGAGLRIKIFDQALMRLEWGFPLADDSITEAGHSRFHFSIDFQDKLPEELERIRKIIEELNIKQWVLELVNAELARTESIIRLRLYYYLREAAIDYEFGDLKESKILYEKIFQICKSLYQQAEEYVRACMRKQKELREDNRLALLNYKAGRLNEAKQLWEKIINEAKVGPLVLEF